MNLQSSKSLTGAALETISISSKESMPEPRRPDLSRFVEIYREGDLLFFSYERGMLDEIGLRFREKEMRWLIKSRLKRLGPLQDVTVPHGFAMKCGPQFSERLPALFQEIDKSLVAMARRPLTPPMIEEALDITVHERLRWTKERRLPISGHASFRKGQKIVVVTYPVDEISDLMRTPEIIAVWRASDRISR